MYAISFDLDYLTTKARHPKGISQAYREIAATLGRYSFRRIQQSVFMTDDEDLGRLFTAIAALKALSWFPDCVKDVRGFRVEQWSDFTAIVKGRNL